MASSLSDRAETLLDQLETIDRERRALGVHGEHMIPSDEVRFRKRQAILLSLRRLAQDAQATGART